jgi:hypothetical protein
MKKIPFISIVSLLIFIFSSCKKNSLPINPGLAGNWQWEYSVGGIAGGKTVPEKGRKRVLSFYGDSLFSVTENGNPSFGGTFQVITDTTIGKIIRFQPDSFGSYEEIYSIKNNELTLFDYSISDGYMGYYKRIK